LQNPDKAKGCRRGRGYDDSGRTGRPMRLLRQSKRSVECRLSAVECWVEKLCRCLAVNGLVTGVAAGTALVEAGMTRKSIDETRFCPRRYNAW
jgi:hypothetical protein